MVNAVQGLTEPRARALGAEAEGHERHDKSRSHGAGGRVQSVLKRGALGHVKRNATRQVASDGPRRAAVVAAIEGRLDPGTWKRIYRGLMEWPARGS
jgi:hypothetical protein